MGIRAAEEADGRARAARAGRNDPPCGSGRKTKACHGTIA